METAAALTKTLRDHNLKGEVIIPGFGMTETCAGCIYGKTCPSYDVEKGYATASLGKLIPGMQMRIADTTGGQVRPNEVGDLQVTCEQVSIGSPCTDL